MITVLTIDSMIACGVLAVVSVAAHRQRRQREAADQRQMVRRRQLDDLRHLCRKRSS